MFETTVEKLTPRQVQLIKSTAPAMRQYGDGIASVFYADVFAKAPEMNNMFNRSAQDNGHQARAVANALHAYASHIDELGCLSPAFQQINSIHASMYVRPEHYVALEDFLMGAMAQVLGSAFDEEVHGAWVVAYRQLANIFAATESKYYEAPASKGWADWQQLQIVLKVKESEVITSFYLGSVDGKCKVVRAEIPASHFAESSVGSPLPAFLPGQFVSVNIEVPNLGFLQSRQYSLSEAPRSDFYRISVKREDGAEPSHPGYVSNILHDAKDVGSTLNVSYPQGVFHLDLATPKDCPVVLIGAGVGVTPLLSMLNACLVEGSQRPISILLGARSKESRAFHDHLKRVAAAHEHVRYKSFLKSVLDGMGESDQHVVAGRLCLEKVDSVSDLYITDQTTHYFMCGPTSFMSDVSRSLVTMGVGIGRVHEETFGPGRWPESEDSKNIEQASCVSGKAGE